MFKDVAVSGGKNVIKKEAQKIIKYKDVTIETRCMWSVKAKVISVILIIGAAGIISD
jgi:hypothetical protein